MSNWKLETPIVLIIFKRPDTTAKVFAEIAKAKPPKLLVIADGPRPNHLGEAERCVSARAVVERVDWDCEVLTNYTDVNLGCKRRVSSGLDWVFEQCEEAIILEDDCLPHPTFFRFCDELLEKYRDDERVMMIAGANLLLNPKRTKYSYHFSRFLFIWGWASWRRAWQHFDVDMKRWPELRETSWLSDIGGDDLVVDNTRQIYDKVHKGEIDTWAYQWGYSCALQGGLSITPKNNLISNIGFGEEATHTKKRGKYANFPIKALKFPLLHPPQVERDEAFDRPVFAQMLGVKRPGITGRILKKMRPMFPDPIRRVFSSLKRNMRSSL